MTRVVCFYTDLHPLAAAALAEHAPGAELVETPKADTHAYYRELEARWTGESDLICIEGDKEIHAGVLPSFDACPHQWCHFGSLTSGTGIHQYSNVGLGACRFRGELQRAVPFSAFDTPDDPRQADICRLCNGAGGRCWMFLDLRMAAVLFRRAYVLCDHGEIPHHHPRLRLAQLA